MSNVQKGTSFEEQLVELLGKNGFWATGIPKDKEGRQPCDVIACNKSGVYLMDAKNCESGRFDFSRVEDNQISAMELIGKRAKGLGYFVCNFPDGIYIYPYKYIKALMEAGANSTSDTSNVFKMESWLYVNRDF